MKTLEEVKRGEIAGLPVRQNRHDRLGELTPEGQEHRAERELATLCREECEEAE
jgi:hypothetical protein